MLTKIPMLVNTTQGTSTSSHSSQTTTPPGEDPDVGHHGHPICSGP